MNLPDFSFKRFTEASYERSFNRETFRLHSLRQEILLARQLEGPYEASRWRKILQVFAMWQVIRKKVESAAAQQNYSQ